MALEAVLLNGTVYCWQAASCRLLVQQQKTCSWCFNFRLCYFLRILIGYINLHFTPNKMSGNAPAAFTMYSRLKFW